ncbi:MAG: arsenate reductase ArsC [Paracoccaceae bacterium]
MNVLVLCTGNSARSILLEAILNRQGAPRVRAFSAGSQPAGAVHPQSLRLLRKKEYDVSGLRSKSLDEFFGPDAPHLDVVITVCDSAAAETCPIWSGVPVQVHWGVPDPAAANPAEQLQVFQNAYATLKRRAMAFLALPTENLESKSLKTDLQMISRIE